MCGFSTVVLWVMNLIHTTLHNYHFRNHEKNDTLYAQTATRYQVKWQQRPHSADEEQKEENGVS